MSADVFIFSHVRGICWNIVYYCRAHRLTGPGSVIQAEGSFKNILRILASMFLERTIRSPERGVGSYQKKNHARQLIVRNEKIIQMFDHYRKKIPSYLKKNLHKKKLPTPLPGNLMVHPLNMNRHSHKRTGSINAL